MAKRVHRDSTAYARPVGPGLMDTYSIGTARPRPGVTARPSVGAFTKGNLGDSNTAPERDLTVTEPEDWEGESYNARTLNGRAKPARRPRVKNVDPLKPRKPRGALTRGIPARRETYVAPSYVNAEFKLGA